MSDPTIIVVATCSAISIIGAALFASIVLDFIRTPITPPTPCLRCKILDTELRDAEAECRRLEYENRKLRGLAVECERTGA